MNKARGVQKQNNNIVASRNSFGELVTNPRKLANLLNVQFSGLGNYIGPQCPNQCSVFPLPPSNNV